MPVFSWCWGTGVEGVGVGRGHEAAGVELLEGCHGARVVTSMMQYQCTSQISWSLKIKTHLVTHDYRSSDNRKRVEMNRVDMTLQNTMQ